MENISVPLYTSQLFLEGNFKSKSSHKWIETGDLTLRLWKAMHITKSLYILTQSAAVA